MAAHQRSRQASAALLVVSCLVLSACGGDDAADGAGPPSTAVDPTTQPGDLNEQVVRRMAQGWYETLRQISYEGVAIEMSRVYIDDAYRAALEEELEDIRSSGETVRLSEKSSMTIESVEIDDRDAVVIECVEDADEVLDEDGDVIDDDVEVRRFSTESYRGNRGWLFVSRTELPATDGAEECPS